MNSRHLADFSIHRTAKLFHGLAFLFLMLGGPSFAQVPQVQHVVIVLEENTNYVDVCGPNTTSLPFLCSLKSQGSFSANYYAPTHPSIGNYNDLGWGVVTTNDDSCIPDTCGFPYSADNIVREIEATGKTWKGYAENLPNACYFGGDTGQYAVRHSPIPYIADVQSNCLNRYVAFEDSNAGFAKDLANNSLPAYAFITPNLCDDAHDCGLPGSPIPDAWLQTNVIQPLLGAGHLDSKTGDTVLIVTFDESRSDNTNGGGLVYWFMMGKSVKQNYQSTGPSASPGFYSHESTLRVIAEMLGAGFSGLGGAANAPDMTEFFETPSTSLSPASLTFGNQTVGSASQAQTITLSNTGGAALSIASIAATGDFAETDNCGTSLAASGTCSINVTFTPAASGTRTGTLSVTDDSMGSPHTVTLTGTGVPPPAPSVSLSPASLTFGNQAPGSASQAQTVTLSNTGNAALSIAGIAATGDFAETNNCGTSLAALGNCSINVTFTPAASGTRTGNLSITDNATGSPHTVTLTGTGVPPAIPRVSLSPASLTFGNQALGSASQAQTVTLSNTGNAALSIAGIAATGDFAETNNCGSSLSASGTCSINVTFTPAASGTRTGNLSITDNATGSPQTVSLSGTGSSAPPDFSLSVSPLSATITAGQSATFTLTVTPAGGFNQNVTLTCAGAPQGGTCVVSPANLTANGSSASMASISLSTAARGFAPRRQRPRGISPQLLGEMELAKIFCSIAAPALLVSFLVGRRRQLLLPLGFAMLAMALAGCNSAGGSLTSNPGSNSNTGTPAGAYTLTIVATSGSAALSHSATATLTVE